MPWEKGVGLTPLPEPGKTDYLAGLVSDAVANGARVMNPNGGIVDRTFFYPAVLYPVNNKMKVYYEEQFGPVIPVVPFENDTEPVSYVLNSHFGQQLSLFGKDSKRIAHYIDAFANQVGRINLNTQCQRGPDSFLSMGERIRRKERFLWRMRCAFFRSGRWWQPRRRQKTKRSWETYSATASPHS